MSGPVIGPVDPGYDEARRVWNADIDRRPAVIARCVSAADAAAAVTYAAEHDLEIAVRGGAHSMSGMSVVDCGLMIDLSQLNQVTVDPQAKRARAGGGALLADLDCCAALGMPLLQAAGPWPYSKFPTERKPEMRWYGEIERFLTFLATASKEAERRGVTIVLKPHTGATATGGDLVDLIGRIDSPAVRACWDAGNVRFYVLPAAWADVDDDAVVGQAAFCRGLGHECQHAVCFVGWELGDVAERIDVALRYHEQMHRRLRMEIGDRDEAVRGPNVLSVAHELAEKAALTRLGQESPPRSHAPRARR